MPTECSADVFGFTPVAGRSVIASFDGGAMTSDAGALLLGATNKVLGLTQRLAACFKDSRDPAYIEHTVETLVMQRITGIALGYEDLNDHDQLRHDPVMAVLAGETQSEMAARDEAERRGKPARRFKDFRWSTLNSWSRTRRLIGKAEWTQGEANPRFVVTSLKPAEIDARRLYEVIYCARGEMENRIKECQLDLFADRTSAATMRANQLRLWFASFGYVLLCALRRIGLGHTQFATATCGTISQIETAEDRRPGEAQCQARGGGNGLRMPLSARIRTGARAPATSRRLRRHEPDTATISPRQPHPTSAQGEPRPITITHCFNVSQSQHSVSYLPTGWPPQDPCEKSGLTAFAGVLIFF
jgi:hypothetical protein